MATTEILGAPAKAVEERVLGLVGALIAELGPLPAHRSPGMDDFLDRDLGIGSLERVELLLRLEEAFGVRLADAVMAEAETPRDLARAVVSAAPAVPERIHEALPPLAAAARVPASAATLVDVLRRHAERDPARVHIFLREESDSEQPITYGGLLERADRVAAGLAEHGIARGQSVGLMLRTEAAFFEAFFGTLLAGGVPVPIYPPFRMDRIEEYARRQAGILRNAQVRLLITFAGVERLGRLLRGRVPTLGEVTSVERLAASGARPPALSLGGGSPALIQYTSGSTGEPKGVLLSHANILANIRAIGEALAIRPDDVAVSWLPLYHDMGLIGSWLGSLYFGIPIAILSPLAFLSRPARWLRTVHAHRGTLSPAPNFAFDLCVRKVRDAEIEGLDLGSWRLALNGSEPVSPETIERFTRRFAAYGFTPEAMCPVYGLAESSVGLTASPPGRPPRVDRVAREPFQQRGQALPATPAEPHPLCFVSCGRPLPGHQVRIVDAAGRPLPERSEGRIEFSGPSVTAGYFRNPEATRAVRRDGWMDAGDLGYLSDGELFVTGRVKDIVIKAGRNLYPQEVEEVVGDIPGIRKGCVAAFGIPDATLGTERLVVVAESREAGPETRERIERDVMDRVMAVLGIPPDAVLLAPPGTVLKTSSGKVRRSAMREAYLGGTLGRARPSARAQWTRLVLEGLRATVRRAAARSAALLYAAYVGGLLVLTWPLLWLSLIAFPSGRPAHGLARLWCQVILALAGCPIRVEGLEHLRGVGPAVLVANHSSYLDAVALLAGLPGDFRFVAKRELLRAPVIGTVIRKGGHLTVNRTDLARSLEDADRASAALRGGVSLLVFPEGTFVRAPGLLPFKLGAFKAASESGCPVIPVTIRGTREILPADTWLPRQGPITLAIGAPIAPEGDGWPALVRLRDCSRETIARRLGEEPLSAS
ncbi:MAG: hypothetical protein A2X53_07010 [Candidatus Rokubacteria bacterium GWA2_70_23]|nr:MAG: hypothetical protein A2X53_07010 [Candidatus Rokubacteria bacterium GWA2_70_23]